ncbi:hypothetical protein LJR225_000504 [Phenylobacterium sp. LjRoot225]|uniref:hypothetical protein n=1 Tax=Phenylobacterium sp. LjRoot225 TaxID=3342285 RepID=UPI003ECDAD40
MSDHVKKIKDGAQCVNRALQEWLSILVLFMGVLQFLLLILQIPAYLKDMFGGDLIMSKAFLMSVIAIGICWAQWRYRHVVYPQMRRQAKACRG